MSFDPPILDNKGLQQILHSMEPDEILDPEVEQILLKMADEFIDNVASCSAQLARHRNSNVVEAKDVLLHLEKHWDMHVPGFDVGGKHLKSGSNDSISAHRARMDTIRRDLNPRKSTQASSSSSSSSAIDAKSGVRFAAPAGGAPSSASAAADAANTLMRNRPGKRRNKKVGSSDRVATLLVSSNPKYAQEIEELKMRQAGLQHPRAMKSGRVSLIGDAATAAAAAAAQAQARASMRFSSASSSSTSSSMTSADPTTAPATATDPDPQDGSDGDHPDREDDERDPDEGVSGGDDDEEEDGEGDEEGQLGDEEQDDIDGDQRADDDQGDDFDVLNF